MKIIISVLVIVVAAGYIYYKASMRTPQAPAGDPDRALEQADMLNFMQADVQTILGSGSRATDRKPLEEMTQAGGGMIAAEDAGVGKTSTGEKVSKEELLRMLKIIDEPTNE